MRTKEVKDRKHKYCMFWIFLKKIYRWLNRPAKNFLFPVVLVFLAWLDLDAGSTVTYLIWKPPAVTEASLRNFKVMTLPVGGGERHALEQKEDSSLFCLTVQWHIISQKNTEDGNKTESRSRVSSFRVHLCLSQ